MKPERRNTMPLETLESVRVCKMEMDGDYCGVALEYVAGTAYITCKTPKAARKLASLIAKQTGCKVVLY